MNELDCHNEEVADVMQDINDHLNSHLGSANQLMQLPLKEQYTGIIPAVYDFIYMGTQVKPELEKFERM